MLHLYRFHGPSRQSRFCHEERKQIVGITMDARTLALHVGRSFDASLFQINIASWTLT